MQDYEVWTTRMAKPIMRAHEAWLRRGRTGAGRLELTDANLKNARPPSARLSFARLDRCDISCAQFQLFQLDGIELLSCHGHGANLLGSNMNGATIDACDLPEAVISGAWLDQCSVRSTSFVGTHGDRASFEGSKFTNVDFSDGNLADPRMVGTTFLECRFERADLRMTANLPRLARVEETEFVGCDLRSVAIDGLRMRGVKFIRCRMHGIQGKPVLEGPVEVIDPDLSVAGDGSKIVAGSEVLKAWA